MIIFIFIIIFLFLFIIYLFASPRFSPIPYFPTNHQDLNLIIKALNLKNNQTVIDLGAGSGTVIFAAASNTISLNTKFIAIDINPVLISIMHLRRLFHPNRKNIKIIWGDLFKIKYNSLTRKPACPELVERVNSLTFYLYVSPWLLEKLIENLKLKIENFSVVSYFYPIKSLKPKKVFKGKNNIYSY